MNWTKALPLIVVILFPCRSAATEVGPVVKFAFDTGGGYVAIPGPTGQQLDRAQTNYGPSVGLGVSLLNDAGTTEGEFTFMLMNQSSVCQGRYCPPPPPDYWTWDRVSLNALGFYRWGKVRLGGGLTYDVYQKLQGFGNQGAAAALDVKSGPGAVLEVDWRIGDAFNLGLRYTKQYFQERGTGTRIDGSAIGVVFTISGHSAWSPRTRPRPDQETENWR